MPHDSAPITAALGCDPAHALQAQWALVQLGARALARPLEGPAAGEQPDVGYGDVRGRRLTLPHDPRQWRFAWDREPDAARDPLAFTAWWLSRAEEALAPPDAADEHGRFRYEASAQSRGGGALGVPVDDLAIELLGPLAAAGAARAWTIVATHDIDVPWLGTESGVRRQLRAARADLGGGRAAMGMRRIGAVASLPAWRLAGIDPWCNAARVARLEARHAATSTSYVHVGGDDPHDGDTAALARGAGRYVRHLLRLGGAASASDRLGLHGSYAASSTPGLLEHELVRLDQLAGARLGGVDHRFHYLRHQVPGSWRLLAELGIRSDSSLGWAEQPGFRAGTAHPFSAWDHERGELLPGLTIIPLAFMDASLDERYLGAGPGDAGRAHLDAVLDVVERVGGCASLLWHNDRLGGPGSRAWTRLYRHALDRVPDGAITAADATRRYAARTAASAVLDVDGPHGTGR